MIAPYPEWRRLILYAVYFMRRTPGEAQTYPLCFILYAPYPGVAQTYTLCFILYAPYPGIAQTVQGLPNIVRIGEDGPEEQFSRRRGRRTQHTGLTHDRLFEFAPAKICKV